MKIHEQNPPRVFEVGFEYKRRIKDCAHVELAADEQVTFTTENGGEYDLARKSWGFYATPSLNNRLMRWGLRGVLVKNRLGYFYILLVEKGHEADFQTYLDQEQLHIITWLDGNEALENLEEALRGRTSHST